MYVCTRICIHVYVYLLRFGVSQEEWFHFSESRSCEDAISLPCLSREPDSAYAVGVAVLRVYTCIYVYMYTFKDIHIYNYIYVYIHIYGSVSLIL